MHLATVLTFIYLITSSNAEELDGLNNSLSTTDSDIYDVISRKDEDLANCIIVVLDPGEYELFPNGTLYVEVYNKLTVEESKYIILDGGIVKFCSHITSIDEENEKNKLKEQSGIDITAYMTLGGLIISIICLAAHLVVFTIVPELKNMPGYSLAALCTSLLCSYILIVITNKVSEYRHVCIAVALFNQFFLLSSFMWMSIMSFDVFVSLLRATGSFRVSSTQFKLKKFVMYSVIAFGSAFIVTLITLLAHILESVPQFYRPAFEKMCWFNSKVPLLIFFAAPVISLTILNFIFFLLSAYTIHANKMKSGKVNHQSSIQTDYLMYFRLSVIMGITWTLGIVSIIAHTAWLRYLFVFVNTLQGLFIFLAFTCNKRVKKYFYEKFIGKRRPSEFNLTPTFQSYCYYSNSIEKDLDKIVETDKQNIDTIVIHL